MAGEETEEGEDLEGVRLSAEGGMERGAGEDLEVTGGAMPVYTVPVAAVAVEVSGAVGGHHHSSGDVSVGVSGDAG